LDELNTEDEDDDDMCSRKKNMKIQQIQKENTKKKDELNCWAKNLRDAVLCFTFLGDGYTNFLYDILEIIEKDSPRLKTLELFSCDTITFNVVKNGDRDEEVKTIMNDISYKLKDFSSIKELTISTDLEKTEDLGDTIKKLKKLKKLTINIQRCDTPTAWDKSFPFKDLGIIKELTIIIRPDFNSTEWGNTLSMSLHHLGKLEVLKILDESNGMMSLKALKPFVKNCKLLKNLKSVRIESNIKSLLVEKKGFLEEELEICIRQNQEEILYKAQALLFELTTCNKMLRSFYIGRFFGFYHTALKY